MRVSRRTWLLAGVLVSAGLYGCATARVQFPGREEYVFPEPEQGLFKPSDRERLLKAWRNVLSANAQAAARSFTRLGRQYPSSAAPPTGLAFARLRENQLNLAGALFTQTVERHPRYLPALLGAAATAARRRDVDGALGYYSRALALEPGLPAPLKRRHAEVRLQVTERRVAAALQALGAGDRMAAITEYGHALVAAPELAEIRLTLAQLMESEGLTAEAAAVLAADPRNDRRVQLRLGETLTGLRRFVQASDVYARLLTSDPRDGEARKGYERLLQQQEFWRMPEEYRRIYSAARITRADLAALIAVKIKALDRLQAQEPSVVTDISGSWAKQHVLRVLGYGIMDVYPNHTFQPAATVRRGDLAWSLSQILDQLRWPQATPPEIRDMWAAHLYHSAAVRSVSAGLLELSPTGAFEPWRAITGPEAVAAVEALARLVGP
jgi:tetratricopeptide (TPR) repeat protein